MTSLLARMSWSCALAWVALGGPVAQATRPSDFPKDTPVMEAVLEGKAATLEALLRDGAPVDLPGHLLIYQNSSPLMVACESGGTDIVRVLLRAGADVALAVPRHEGSWPPYGWTARCFARAQGQSYIEQLLRDAGARGEDACLTEADFLSAVREQEVQRAATLGQQARGKLQSRVLGVASRYALEYKNAELMRSVVVAGYKPALDDGPRSDSPVNHALLIEDPKTLQVLLEAGAKSPPLAELAERGMTDLVKRALKAGADPNALEGYSPTPLVAALKGGHRDVVKVLLDAGAEVNLASPQKQTPLLIALRGAVEGPPDITLVTWLLDAGADVNQDDGSHTPLLKAAGRCCPDIVAMLLRRGARWDLPPRRGAALYEEALRMQNFCPEDITVSVLQALKAGGVLMREDDEADRPFLWRNAQKNPAFGAVLREAGLPPEPERRVRSDGTERERPDDSHIFIPTAVGRPKMIEQPFRAPSP